MASPAGFDPRPDGSDLRQLERALATLLNKQLQTICTLNGLKTGGVKAELQARIRTALYENFHAAPDNYANLRQSIINIRGDRGLPPANSPQPAMGSSASPTTYSAGGRAAGQSSQTQRSGYQPGLTFGNGSTAAYKMNGQAGVDIYFNRSPFYQVERRVGEIRTCDIMSQHRNTIHIPVKTHEFPWLQDCQTDKSLRVMLFCAAELHGLQDISFPHQSEIKVNGSEIKANLRGLKGKPGSTRPVDITDSLRLRQFNYANNVEFTYALTSKKFYVALYLCRVTPVDSLVNKIKTKKISKATVIHEFTKAANDPDVVATSTVLSLKCPLSYMRLRLPCRSTTCTHIQCFDGTSYLQLQEQGPQWLCPVCNKSAPFDSLAVDEYVRDILERTSEEAEQVTIEPNGQWREQGEEPNSDPAPQRSSPSYAAKIEDDDELVMLSAPQSNGARGGNNSFGTPNRSFASGGTRPAPTPTQESSGTPKTGNKRTAEVIDLTLSSDDEEEPVLRAPKRQNQGGVNGNGTSLDHFPHAYY